MTSNPYKLSYLLSIILSLFVFSVIFVLFRFLFKIENAFYFSFGVLVVCIPIFYFVLKYAIERFLYDRIRVLYKTILTSKQQSLKKDNDLTSKEILIENVNNEVKLWADKQAKEISELKKLEAYRREFLGNVSHELKTPITTIQGYVLTLLEGGIEDENINIKYLQRTAKSIDRLIAIVNDLEEISKFEAGVIELNINKINFALIVSEVIEFMEIKARKKNIKLEFVPFSDYQTNVWGDKEKLKQVLINLIDNSLKYGKDNGKTTISTFEMDDHILVEISDNGIGIEENELPRVFERFYRTEKSRTRAAGGTGLGLAIVKHIIEAHHQTIHVRSNIDVGSTFSFTLKKA